MAKISHTIKAAEMRKMAGDKVSFSVLPGRKDEGKAETGVACRFVPICLKHRRETLPIAGPPPVRKLATLPRAGLPARNTVTLSESQKTSEEEQTDRIHQKVHQTP